VNDLLPSDKKKIYDLLADSYLDAIEKGLLTQETRQALSQEILDYIEKEEYWGGLMEFVDDLLARYTFLSPAVEKIHDYRRKVEKKYLVQKLEQDIEKLHTTN
jgi:methionine synthase II (cobalamin-independent)